MSNKELEAAVGAWLRQMDQARAAKVRAAALTVSRYLVKQDPTLASAILEGDHQRVAAALEKYLGDGGC